MRLFMVTNMVDKTSLKRVSSIGGDSKLGIYNVVRLEEVLNRKLKSYSGRDAIIFLDGVVAMLEVIAPDTKEAKETLKSLNTIIEELKKLVDRLGGC